MSNELGLRLDVKYNRIYIHRATLKAIGNPAFDPFPKKRTQSRIKKPNKMQR